MNLSDLNAAARLVMVAKNCGAEFLDDPDRFDRMFGRGSFAETDGHVLDLVRRVVKPGDNRVGEHRVYGSQPAQNVD
jgi:predicted lactoylglutathione lyase